MRTGAYMPARRAPRLDGTAPAPSPSMTEILERGDLSVYYRGKVRDAADDSDDEPPRALDDIQRLFLVLGSVTGTFRVLVIGRKRLPERGERFWGYLEVVTRDRDRIAAELAPVRYQTRTRGERLQPPARLAGEGSYALVRHDDHVHLAYRLDRPRQLDDVHLTLRLLPSGSFIVAAFEWKVEDGARSGARRFTPATPARLDRDGVELVVIGTDEEPEQALGISLSV